MLECAKISQYMFRGFLTLNTTCAVLIVVLPTVEYFLTGEMPTAFYHRIIGVDATKTVGYAITMVYHAVACMAINIFLIYFDGIYVFYVFNAWVFSGLIVHQVNQLNKILEDRESSKDYLCIWITFRNIIKMNREMNE